MNTAQAEVAVADEAVARVMYFGKAYDGPGWYYWEAEYPDEGIVGAFKTRDLAVAHARSAGYDVVMLAREFG